MAVDRRVKRSSREELGRDDTYHFLSSESSFVFC